MNIYHNKLTIYYEADLTLTSMQQASFKPLHYRQKLLHVIRPVKTGHLGTNNTLSHNKSFLSIATKYWWSVTYTIKI